MQMQQGVIKDALSLATLCVDSMAVLPGPLERQYLIANSVRQIEEMGIEKACELASKGQLDFSPAVWDR
jgi:hypothetical protein